jgi:O-antigen/teichoic acid export membrane protein
MIAFPFILNSLLNFAIGLLVARYLGPGEYGQYALALSIAVVVQTFAFDWLRLCATRFYSEHDRRDRPEIRATLNAVFSALTGVFVCAAIVIALSGLDLPLSGGLIALAIVSAIANGWFDFSAALARARFNNRAYGTLVVVKIVLSISLSVGGAWYFGSAKIALAGLVLSVAGSLAATHRVLRDQDATMRRADRKLALRYALYALPIVVANVLYQAVPAADRAWISEVHGFAQAGQLALAFEIGIRIIGAIGSALDVLLFQVAVLAEKTLGEEAARRQVARNMGVQLAILVPAVAGCWIVLPSFEHVLVPESFRGPFAHYFTLLLPAIQCFAVSNYCLGPAFQIAHRTMPLIAGGLAAVAANGLAVLLLPATADASGIAMAQSISSTAGLAVTIGFLFTLEPMWPSARDIAGTLTGTGAMLLAAMPLRAMEPGWIPLLAQATLGAFVYALAVLVFDVAQVRTMLLTMVAPGRTDLFSWKPR